ncbi:MAG: hypothetical protein HC806_05950 [Anaerolineae bacterium]|nr:hypothetical protein [Anaerolineae bacterium]
MAGYKILTLDGGGILGIITCKILEKLNDELPGWLDKVDLIAGTSTGGIIAIGLAYGLTPAEIGSLYYDRSPEIFYDTALDNVLDLGNLIGAQYSTEDLKRVLKETLGEKTRLVDLKKKVLIPTFDLDNEKTDEKERCWAPKFFHNFEGEDCDKEALAYKVALYTSAAPTYFPTYEGYIDGGVIANNPSMAAIAQTRDYRAIIPNRPSLREIRLLSVGSGVPLYRIKEKTLDWGLSQWARPIIEIMLNGNMGVADYQSRQLLGENYLRTTATFKPDDVISLDDWRKREKLKKIGEDHDVTDTVRWLQENWI